MSGNDLSSSITALLSTNIFLWSVKMPVRPIWQYVQSKEHTLMFSEMGSMPRELPILHDETGPYIYLYLVVKDAALMVAGIFAGF